MVAAYYLGMGWGKMRTGQGLGAIAQGRGCGDAGGLGGCSAPVAWLPCPCFGPVTAGSPRAGRTLLFPLGAGGRGIQGRFENDKNRNDRVDWDVWVSSFTLFPLSVPTGTCSGMFENGFSSWPSPETPPPPPEGRGRAREGRAEEREGEDGEQITFPTMAEFCSSRRMDVRVELQHARDERPWSSTCRPGEGRLGDMAPRA
jgi:hypothetical protein